MIKAEELALSLASKFFENGNYTLSSIPTESKGIGLSPVTTNLDNEEQELIEEVGYVGLPVNSVGFANNRVFIYTTKKAAKKSQEFTF